MINFLRRKKNESVLGKNHREKSFLPYNSMQDILIVFNTSDLADVNRIVGALQQDGKTVTAWTVRPKDKSAQVDYPPYVKSIDISKDLTWSKTLIKPIIDKFDEMRYDTFLDLTTSDDTILDYLLASNSSRFCIGMRERQIKAYDFVMLKKDDHTLFETYEQLKYYLNSIIE